MAYVFLLEDLRRMHESSYQAAAIARAMGADAELRDWPQVREQFDDLLVAAPDGGGGDPDQAVLLAALGLR